jgi:CRISPR-associated endoribonuclease Cas6
MNAIRLYIDLPRRGGQKAVIQDRDQVANLLTGAMRKYGYHPPENRPTQWGFGVIAKRLNPHRTQGRQRLHMVQRVVVGSTHPDIAAALAQLQSEDLFEPNSVPGASLDMRSATIYAAPPWQATEAAAFYCVSPIRVTDPNPHGSPLDFLQTGDALNQRLNRTMQTRFGRPFDLSLIPDSLYVRANRGKIDAGMAIKTLPNGKPLVVRGLVLPFVLTGAVEDLRDVWYSGLGRSTARGFGCVEMQQ